MKRLNIMMICGCLTWAASPTMASHDDGGYDWAKVVDARPVYQSVRYPVDQQVCWDEQVWHREPRAGSATPVILGTIIGGIIGNQFGDGSGQVAMTAAGAMLGGAIANDASQRRYPDAYYPANETRCRVETDWHSEDRVVAWDVAYKYHGEIYQTRMREHPGKRIRVRVQVDPLGY